MKSTELKQQIKQLIAESNAEFHQVAGKTSIGTAGGITAATVNSWIGIAVGAATLIYMILQIESAWRKRRAAKKAQKQVDEDV